MSKNVYLRIEKIVGNDPRYKADAYEFVIKALRFTQQKLGRQGHVSGRELLEGIKDFGIDQYGPLVRMVFEHWGIRNTEDFGAVVFNMVEDGMFGKTNGDSPEDFKNVYDFASTFNIFNAGKD